MRDRIYNIVKHSAGRLRHELPHDSRLLVFFFEPFSGELEVCWPLNGVPEISQHIFALTHECFTRQKEILVEDSSLAPIFEAAPPEEIGSALAVPLLDPDGVSMGVVYADNPQKLAIGIQEKEAIQSFVAGQQKRIPRWTFAKDVPEPTETPGTANPAITLVGLVAMLVMGYTVFLSPRIHGGANRPVQLVESSPMDSARTFRALLVRKDIAGARNRMTDALCQRWSEDDMLKWLTRHKNGWGFEGRDVTVVSSKDDKARIRLLPKVSNGETVASPGVEFDLVRVDGQWKVDRVIDEDGL